MPATPETLIRPAKTRPGSRTKRNYVPIENHGVIGNLHTVALISLTGSIDFMCFTRFDSPTIFAALLDDTKGGFFDIAPVRTKVGHKQLYLPDTNILITRFLSEEGIAELTDFMPVKTDEQNCILIRSVTAIRGKMRFRMRCQPRFDYGRAKHTLKGRGKKRTFVSRSADGLQIHFYSNVALQSKNGDLYAEFTLNEGETAHFVLEAACADKPNGAPTEEFVKHHFYATVNYWKNWLSKCEYTGRWREIVYRSALTLKLLTSHRYGSAIAAATFGLPELVGGVRNWDYRYTWIRDAAFTMYAFIRLGLREEAGAFMGWIEKEFDNMDDDGHLQLMYKLDGGQDIDEMVLGHLEGYRGSSPVRIGNAAYQQTQLDIYGELMDSVYLYNKYGELITYKLWRKMQLCIEYVCRNWEQADHGIWEVRSEKREFILSRIMCWVAIDRGIRLAEKRSLPAPIDRWREIRDQIYQDVYDNFWNEEKQAYVQYKHGSTLDASVLMMPLVRFISPVEPRWLSTLRAVERELASDSLVYRYRVESIETDGLDGREGTFSICSFWYVESLARSGEVEKARLYFEKMLGYANHLGLFSEQLGYQGEHLGNFPQAFTHLGLISAAFELDRRLGK